MVDFTGEIKFNNTPDSLEKEMSTKTMPSGNKSVTRRKGAASASMSVMSTEGTYNSKTAASTLAGRSSLSRTNREMEEHDKHSEKVVLRLKMAILLFFTLTAVGVATAFFVYRSYNKRTQEAAFKTRFKEEAENMLANIGANIDSTLGAFDAFTVSMLAQAQATNQTWPYVTIDNFGVQAGKLLKNSRAIYVNTYNWVAEGEREKWEKYAKTHSGWIDQSIDVQSRDPGYTGPEITEEWLATNYTGHYDILFDNYETVMYGNSTDGVDHGGPYLPIWQSSPVIPSHPIYNWDFMSNNSYPEPLNAVLDTHLVTITEPYMINWPWDLHWEEEHEWCADWWEPYLPPGANAREPMVDIYYPIIVSGLDNVRHHEETYNAQNYKTSGYDTEENRLGGLLAASIRFRDSLRDLLPTGSAGVIVVYHNPCDVPPFGYEISGPIPEYLGTGYHNETVGGDPDLNITTSMLGVWDFGIANSSYSGIPVNEEVCPYTIEVYPAASARDNFMENNDNSVYVVLILVLVVSIMTIAFTFLFFFLYDRLVRNEIRAKINLLDAKRNFVRFVSHEVRTPLNTVCMGLTLIHQEFKGREKQLKKKQEGGGDSEETEKAADKVTKEDFARWSSLTQEVSNNADVAVGVLNDLLNIDKIQMGAFKLEMEVLQIWEIVEQTTSEFVMMAEKQNTKLKLDMSKLAKSKDVESAITTASDLPTSITNQKVVGDEQRLQQVLRNLLSNAIKFSKNKSVTVKVSLRDVTSPSASMKDMSKATTEFKMADGTKKSFSASGQIVVDVVDTGVGMTQAQLETVFDVGTQFNAQKLQSGGGSGLGLAFAKAISEQHGGSLRAYSDGKDKGTTFRLDLPLHLNDSSLELSETGPTTNIPTPNGTAKMPENADSGNEDELEPMNILVVDDAPMNRKLLVRLLESNGHTCAQAENGQDLIDNVKKNMVQYDCILVDYEMPVMNGPEACKGVREMGYTGFVVGVTGNLLPEDVGYFMDCGADAVLPKPFKYKELEELLIEHGMFELN